MRSEEFETIACADVGMFLTGWRLAFSACVLAFLNYGFRREGQPRTMFECLLQQLVDSPHGVKERADGIAFLKVAMSAYPIASISYIGLNILIRPGKDRLIQCVLSDKSVKQCMSCEPVRADRLARLALPLRGPLDWTSLPGDEETDALFGFAGGPEAGSQLISFPLRALDGECALLCVGARASADEWEALKPTVMRDFQILGNYFHQHIMRIYGHDASKAMLVSARELDCLRWMAAGKTAWEASVILGISERTVRFHLNAAREKLDCLTTTQAVAKAVSQQLISL